MISTEKPYLTAKEVVGLLRGQGIEVTDDTVRNWCTKGIQNKKVPERRHYLGHFRVGGRLMVVSETIKVFLAELASVSTPDRG